MELSMLSIPRFNDVTFVEIEPSGVNFVIRIFCWPNNPIVCLHFFSIIGGKLTITLTTKHKMRIMHVCKNPLNHFYKSDERESACDPVHLGPLHIHVCFLILLVFCKFFMHECVFYVVPCDLNRLFYESFCICIYGNGRC